MNHVYSFKAHGHENIRSKHQTTLMTTTDSELTPRGDCIIAVSASTGLQQLPLEIKEAARKPETKITLTLIVEDYSFKTVGRGDSELTYSDPVDIVARKSTYTCGRTLMVDADKAATDIPETILEILKDPNTIIKIQLTYETQ